MIQPAFGEFVLPFFLSPHTCRYRILLCARVALYTAAPHKLAPTLDLLKVSHRLMSQSTRVAQRFAFVRGNFVSPAGPSQHSRRSYGVVSHAVVWGRVEVNQLSILFRHRSQMSVYSLLKLVVHERHSCSIMVYLLQQRSHAFKRAKLLPASFQSAGSSDTMTLAFPL